MLDPPSIRTPAPNELEYLDVFDFFNYPRVPIAIGDGPLTPVVSNEVANNARNVAAAVAAPVQDFFLTTTFAMPNPESDWLTFKRLHD